MSVAVTLSSGGRGEAVAFEGEVLSLVLPRAFAPGAPVSLEATVDGRTMALNGKALGSKRREDGRFDVRMRMINLRRSERERLSASLRAQ